MPALLSVRVRARPGNFALVSVSQARIVAGFHRVCPRIECLVTPTPGLFWPRDCASHPVPQMSPAPRRRIQRRDRLANEAAEVKRQLSRGRDVEMESLAQSALDVASGSVVEALLRSAVAGAEVLETQEVSASRHASGLIGVLLLSFSVW